MSHWQCVCVDCEDLRRDAERFRFLEKNMTFYDTAESEKPVLASVASRIWYHATDSVADTIGSVADGFSEQGK